MKPAEDFSKPESPKTDKHQAIIAAATRVFLNNGYQNASMDSISCEAGVAKQTLYNYFGNKDALFFAVVEQLCEFEKDSSLLSGDITSANLEATLKKYANNKLVDIVSKENTALYRTIISEAIRFPSLGKRFFLSGMEKDRQLLVDFFTQQHQAGNLNIDDPEQAASFFHGTLNGYFRPKLIMTDETPNPEEVQKYIDYCIKKLLDLYRPTT